MAIKNIFLCSLIVILQVSGAEVKEEENSVVLPADHTAHNAIHGMIDTADFSSDLIGLVGSFLSGRVVWEKEVYPGFKGGLGGEPTDVLWSSSGNEIVVIDKKGRRTVYDSTTGQKISFLKRIDSVPRMYECVKERSWTSDEKHFAKTKRSVGIYSRSTAFESKEPCEYGEIQIWDVEAEALKASFTCSPDTFPPALCLNQAGDRLAVCCGTSSQRRGKIVVYSTLYELLPILLASEKRVELQREKQDRSQCLIQ